MNARRFARELRCALILTSATEPSLPKQKVAFVRTANKLPRIIAMHVLFITRRFPPSVGGMERFAYDLTVALERQALGLKKVAWGGSNKWLPLVLPWLFARALWAVWRNPPVDVIHVQDSALAPLAWTIHKLSGKPFVVVAHGLDVTFPNRVYQAAIPWFVRRAAAVVCNSSATRAELLARGVDESSARVIPLGVNDTALGVGVDRQELATFEGLPDLASGRVLLTVGRLVKRKGVEWFVTNVMPTLLGDFQIIYLVAGEGPERSSIEAAIEAVGLTGRVHLLGYVDESAKWLLYRSCDVFVMPNIKVPGDMEGFGIVAHEAAISEAPVVASDLEGITEALADGKNAILVTPEDVDGYVREIQAFLVDETRRLNFGRGAREFTLGKFEWDAIGARYVELYESLVD